ncbi:N-acetylmuramoyl-L-alanine amidase [Alkalibacillus silvisoli]|uniref:Autolysin n=1 Tax=Alkalibacillus silvisoli TaxID=392823 RepID=A0ABN0ZPB7_9BACI
MPDIEDLRGQTMGGNRRRNKIRHIARHHSASEGGDVWTFERHWKNRGWQTGGYHEIILRDGTVQLCYDEDVITNGIADHNRTTYHICLVGDGNFTDEQERVFEERAHENLGRFGLNVSQVLGHNEFSGARTGCPGIDMDRVRARLGNNSSSSSGGSDSSGSSHYLLQNGDSGSEVEQLQNDLREAGERLPRHGADGIFGDETESAVRSFQRSAGIQVDGIVGPETRQALEEVISNSSELPSGIYRRGDRGEAVRQIQKALDSVRFRPGSIDGIYGPRTEDAIRRFQSVHISHEVDGIYGPNTKAKLEEVLRG